MKVMNIHTKYKDLFIKKSRNGNGVFTKREFKPKETILELKGKLITCYEDDNLDEKTRSNTIRYDSEMFLSPKGELGEIVNHSCDPNSKIVKRNKKLFLISIKTIGVGKELLFDYSTVLASDDIWTMRCNCGSKNCRKIIKSFNKLPKKIQSYYVNNKIIPKYILDIK